MNPLRILHVVGGYPTSEKPYHQIFIKTQVDSLIVAGLDCEVLLLQGPGFRKYATGWPQVRKRLQSGNFDLIHAHYAYCGAVSLGHRLPVVTSFLGSDLYGVPRPDGSYPKLVGRFHLALARFVADRSADSIVKSQRMRNDLKREVHVVPNGVDLAVFKSVPTEERDALRRELGLDSETYYVLFAGNPELPHKRYPLANEAFAKAKHLVRGPMGLLVLSGRPHSDVVKYMKACDMLVLSSSHEGSPNVIKEAMAAGMAVVSVDVGDTRERLAGVSGCRVTSDDSPAAIAAAMLELINGIEPREGPDAVAPLAMGTVAKQIEGIYRKVVRLKAR
jgi:glycosyltransferase involved in cell wall biosynthesis